MILDLDNYVWVSGSNEFGKLGLGAFNVPESHFNVIPTMIPGIKAKKISAGYNNGAIIDLEDNVWVFGDNIYGQLGLGDLVNRSIPTLAYEFTVVLDLENNVWTFGRLSKINPSIETRPMQINGIKSTGDFDRD